MKLKYLILFVFSIARTEVITIEDQNSVAKKIIRENSNKINSDKSDNSNKIVKKKINAITEFSFGNKEFDNDKDRIEIYVAPSCLHCGKFLLEEFAEFLKKYREEVFIKIKILPYQAKDLFVMKLIQGTVQNATGFYTIYINYISRVMATINSIKPTDEQIELYKGSTTDPDMIKYQVIAEEFNFSQDAIIEAIPDIDKDYEQAIMGWYKNEVSKIKNITKDRDLTLPLIIRNNKVFYNLEKILEID